MVYTILSRFFHKQQHLVLSRNLETHQLEIETQPSATQADFRALEISGISISDGKVRMDFDWAHEALVREHTRR